MKKKLGENPLELLEDSKWLKNSVKLGKRLGGGEAVEGTGHGGAGLKKTR